MTSFAAAQLADHLRAQLRGDPARVLRSCATLADAQPDQVSFVTNPKYWAKLADSSAGLVVVHPDQAGRCGERDLLLHPEPYATFRNAMVLLHGLDAPGPEIGVHPLAHVEPSATLGDSCRVGPFAYVGPHAVVGDRCVLHPHSHVGHAATLGDDCTLHPHVCVYHGCVLGDRVTLHAGCSIGQDGFGYATAPRKMGLDHEASHGETPAPSSGDGGDEVVHHKIPQAGNVVIGDDVELGAGCTVDRAAMGSTTIGRGTKTSNAVTVGHGSQIGEHNLLVAQVGLAGSVTTGRYVVAGGQVGVVGHLTLGDGVQLAAQSGVGEDIGPGEKRGGAPAVPLMDFKRQAAALKRLPGLLAKVRRLQRRVEQLESRSDPR